YSAKVKKLEGFLKRMNLVVSDSEEEEPEVQGRKSQDDPLDSSVQGLVTPPTTKVVSLKSRSIDKGRRYQRRKETKGKKVNTASAEHVNTASAEPVNTASAEQISTAEGVNTGIIKLSTVGDHKGQRKGTTLMISEETPKKSKEQILQEEASLAEAIRLNTLQKEEVAKQVHLDSLLAQRIAEEEELTEQQKKRKAQVQFEAQHYTNEDWDLIIAKIEANAELLKSMLGRELQGEDFAKKMVDLLKTLSFKEVKEEFDKLVKQVESFAPINFEATKASLKIFGEELQTKTSKRLKSNEAKDDKPSKKSGKRRK
ncbi:hypothetical protein Tco_1065174, partial [Tanacetum coccineum]